MSDDVTFLSQLVRDSMELQAQEALGKTDDQDKVMKPLQVRAGDLLVAAREPTASEGEQWKMQELTGKSFAISSSDQLTVDGENHLKDHLESEAKKGFPLSSENINSDSQ
ncbi:unnamed protein product [Cuscuta campestris]|uniref:Uncharacterized protein n=1 Tax=Cuscuta campestris TaxID=132261 RepID=A0A484KRQ3_9ASTE|nr:unnamed protein product [Cuscuta campestris]